MRNHVDSPPPPAPLTVGLARRLDAAERAFEHARTAASPVASPARAAARRRVYAALAREARRSGDAEALHAARRWYQDVPLVEGAPADALPELTGEAEALERVLELGGLRRDEIAHLARIRPRFVESGFAVS